MTDLDKLVERLRNLAIGADAHARHCLVLDNREAADGYEEDAQSLRKAADALTASAAREKKMREALVKISELDDSGHKSWFDVATHQINIAEAALTED